MKKIAPIMPALALFAFAILFGGALAQNNQSKKQDETLQLVLKAISAKYEKLADWQASFTQENKSLGLGSGSFHDGEFIFVRPNQIKFSLLGPEHSDFISDGKKAWFIQFPKGRKEAAYVRAYSSLENLELNKYLIFLRGIRADKKEEVEALKKDFDLEATFANNRLSLTLKPKKPIEIVSVNMTFSNQLDAPDKITIEDAVGNQSIIIIKKWKNVEKLNPQWLNPVYPKNSKVEKL